VNIRKVQVSLEINEMMFEFLAKRKARVLIPAKIDRLFPLGLKRQPVSKNAILIIF